MTCEMLKKMDVYHYQDVHSPIAGFAGDLTTKVAKYTDAPDGEDAQWMRRLGTRQSLIHHWQKRAPTLGIKGHFRVALMNFNF